MKSSKAFMVWIIALFIGTAGFGHNPQETFSTLEIQDGRLKFHLELPWSLNRAVLLEYPGLKEADQATIKDYTQKYILQNLEVSQSGALLEVQNISLGDGHHSHSLSVKIEYDALSFEGLSVKNTLLFNYSKKQKNYHLLKQGNGNIENYITTSQQNYFLQGAPILAQSMGSKRGLVYLLIGILFFGISWQFYRLGSS